MPTQRKEPTVAAKDGAIPVRCAYKRLEKTDGIKPHPDNPNQHPDRQVTLLAKIIKSTGWRAPIVVSDRSGFVTKGHCRLLSAKLLGCKKVPVDVQHYADVQEELADVLADNQIAELAFMDEDLLKGALAQLEELGHDFDLAGFDEAALKELLKEPKAPDSFKSVGSDIDTEHQCPKCGYRWSGKAA